MKKVVYLDNNVLIYIKDNRESVFAKRMFNLNENDYTKVYGPAHMEELAGSEIRYNSNRNTIERDLQFIKKFTNSNELLPSEESIFKGISYASKLKLVKEHPKDCYERVIKEYHRNGIAEYYEQKVIDDAHTNSIGSPMEVNNIKIEKLFNDNDKRSIINDLLELGLITESIFEEALNWNFDDIKDKFYLVECYINLAANLIEKIGYYREDNKTEVVRSRLHDVTHMIYAAYCHIFICNDKKLRNKTKAIYYLLNIKTDVYSIEEYMSKS